MKIAASLFCGLLVVFGAIRDVYAQTANCGGAAGVWIVTFNGTDWNIDPPDPERINSRHNVKVCVQHFNFLRYTLAFDISEEKSESYEYLNKLWSSILSPSLATLGGLPLSKPAPPESGTPLEQFVKRLQEIYRMSNEVDAVIGEALQTYQKTGLTDPEATKLASTLGDSGSGLKQQIGQLDDKNEDLQRFLLAPANSAIFAEAIGGGSKVYTAVMQRFTTVRQNADSFVALAGKTIAFETKKVGRRDAGMRVTFKLTAVDRDGAKSPMGDVHYFVNSTMPLVIHGGLSFAAIKDVEFEKVKRASAFGEDELFQAQSESDTSRGYSAFLGWQLYAKSAATSDSERFGLLFSLGTDVSAAGKRVFAGPSLVFFNRAVLTVGAAFGNEEHGEQQTLEPNLFKIIRAEPKASWFFAISTKVK